MYPIGAKVTTMSGLIGTVAILFADGVWVKKFLECPWCDRATWEIRTDQADLSDGSGPQYLIIDDQHYWHIVDDSQIDPTRDPVRDRLPSISGEIG